ncbi:effector-associated domain EAD1-containing protein [Streptomyces sp. NPDC102402]|uniref:effector-associated domain EAD1-containing protein n=1 Tax=Streptomyces sp. NPDC102402 TaxID=3366169 RepID=UPI00380812FC
MDEAPHFVDRDPFDWRLPESQRLKQLLADSYFRLSPVVVMANQAGIDMPSVNWDGALSTVWHDLITKASQQGRLRVLLSQVEAGPDTAVARRLSELLESWSSPEVRTATAGPPSLRAYRLPVNWIPDGDPCPIGDAYLADLGAWLCLDRGPTTTVVAARSGTAWAEALTELEQGAIRHGAGAARDFPEREWLGVQADEAESALQNPSESTAIPGLVVHWSAETYPDGRSVREFLDRLRSAAPQTPVLLAVEAEQAIDAITASTRIGRELGTGRTGAPVEVLAHSRPGDSEGRAPLTAPEAGSDPDPHRLMATVAAQMAGRSLPLPPHPFDGKPLADSDDPSAVAATVVEMLNRSAPWGPPDQEAHAIGLVRDYAPRYFLPLLRRHAAARTGPAHWSSLSAAAAVDDHITVWLERAHTVGPPSGVPRLLRRNTTVEAVLLGLLRTGADEADAWTTAASNRCPAAFEVAKFLASDRQAEEFLPTATAESAVAAARAGKHEWLTAAIRAPEASAAWWAALGRRPLTERTVATLAALSVESRRIAGFTSDQRENDAEFAELSDQMRRAMRPPLPAARVIK